MSDLTKSLVSPSVTPPAVPKMATPKLTAADAGPQVEWDHDRRRVKNAVKQLLAATPPEKKEKLAKALVALAKARAAAPKPTILGESVAGRDKYKTLVPQFRSMAKELASRTEFHPKHDQAAFLVHQAQAQLQLAADHMNRRPSAADKLRSVFGRSPLHLKHLDTAEGMLQTAALLTVDGDRKLYKKGVAPETPFSKMNHPKPTSVMPALTAVYRGGKQIPGAAKRFRDAYHAIKLEHEEKVAREKERVQSIATMKAKGTTP